MATAPADHLRADLIAALRDNDQLAAQVKRLRADNDRLRTAYRDRFGHLPRELAAHTTIASLAPAGSYRDTTTRRTPAQIHADDPSRPKPPPPAPKPGRHRGERPATHIRHGHLWTLVRAHLATHGPCCVSDLIVATGGSQPGISKVTRAYAGHLIIDRDPADRRRFRIQLKATT